MNPRTRPIALLAVLILMFVGLSTFAQRTATAVPTVVNGFVVAITVTDGGTGYTTPPTVTIAGGGGTGASATATVLNGAVDRVIVGNAGVGYTGNPAVTIAGPPSPKPPFSDGLVAYYPFNGNANDASGNAKNGVVNGSTLTPDRFGKPASAYLFSGGQFIDLPIDSSSTKPLTYSVWFRKDKDVGQNPGNGQAIIWTGTFDAPSHNLGIGSPNDDLYIEYYPRGLYQPGFSVRNHQWYHVVVVYSDSVLVFVNGVRIGEVPYPSNPGFRSAVTRLGKSQDFYPNQFEGVIDDVRIYNRALSEQEIRDLYRHESPELPSLGIEVQTVLVTLYVKPANRYQLESSFDLRSWTKVGEPIFAASSEIPVTVNVLQAGQFFRVYEVQ